jgi:hypothetical protein
VLWRIDPLLGRNLEANETAAVAVQRRGKHASTTTEFLLSKHVPAVASTHAMGGSGVLSTRSVPRSYEKKRTGATSQLSSAREDEKTWLYRIVELTRVLQGRLCQEDLSA